MFETAAIRDKVQLKERHCDHIPRNFLPFTFCLLNSFAITKTGMGRRVGTAINT